MINDEQTQFSNLSDSGEEICPFSNSNSNIVDGYLVSLHSIPSSPPLKKTVRKGELKLQNQDNEEKNWLKLEQQKYSQFISKDIEYQSPQQTIQKKHRKQYYRRKTEQQKNAFKVKKEKYLLESQSQMFQTIQRQLKQEISRHLKRIINCLQNKNYIVSGFLNRGGEADVLKGYYLNELNEEEECVFRIAYCQNTNFTQLKEESEIIELFKFSNHTVNIIERIYLEDIQIIIQIIQKCIISLWDEMNSHSNKSYSFRQLIYIISNLIDSIIEFRIHEILHLDIKPQNILRNKYNIYVLSDFGISVMSNNKYRQAKGYTKYYSPPEQIYGGEVSHLSDIYSFGKTIEILIDFSLNQQKKQNIKHRFTLKQKKKLQQIKVLIKNKMTKEKQQDREDCIELLFQFYEIIGKKNMVMQRYFKQKIRMIPYIQEFQNKDAKYMKLLELKYSILYLQIFIDQNKLGININDISKDSYSLNIQTFKDSKVNIVKILKYFTIISCLYFTTRQLQKSITILNHCQNIIQTNLINETIQSSQVIFQLGSLCLEIGHCCIMDSKSKKSVEGYLKFLSTYQKIYRERQNKLNIEFISESIKQRLYQKEEQINTFKNNQNENDLRNKIENYQMSYDLLPSSLCCLANYFEVIPNYKMAYKYQKEAVEIKERNRNENENYFSLIEAKITLGNIMRSLSMYKEAQNQYLGVIDIYKKYYYNVFHQNQAAVYLQLGVNCLLRGQYYSSLYCQISSLWIKLKSYSNIFHPYIASSLSYIGGVFLVYGQLGEGIKFSKMAYFISFQNKNDNNIMGLANFRLGNCYLQYGNPKKARIYNIRSLKQYQKRYPNQENQMEIARCLLKVGLSYLRCGEKEQGKQFCMQSLKMYKVLYQNNIIHPYVADALDGVGECQLALQHFSSSYIHFKLSLRLRLLIYPKHHPDIAISYYFLGQYYEAIEDLRRSIQYYQYALEIRSKLDLPNNQLLKLTKQKLLNIQIKEINFNVK